MKKYNLSNIMKRAWELVKKASMTISTALSKAWAEAKNRTEETMKVVENYSAFNQRRYSNPWVAIVNKSGKIDFSQEIGGYTGTYGKGESGELYITKPEEGAIYAYGQKDYRGNNGGYSYVQYINGSFALVEKTRLIEALNA